MWQRRQLLSLPRAGHRQAARDQRRRRDIKAPRSTPTQFQISGIARPGVEFSQIEQGIDAVIADMSQNPPRAEDLERVKTQLIAEAIYAQDKPGRRWRAGTAAR
jgi:hypothetical protein